MWEDFGPLSDVPLDIEARLDAPALRVSEVLAFKAGTVLVTSHPAGRNVDVFAGEVFIGSAELSSDHGRAVVRMAHFSRRK